MNKVLLDVDKFISNKKQSPWILQFARAFNDLCLVNNLLLNLDEDDVGVRKYRIYLLKLNIAHLNEALKLIHNYKENVEKGKDISKIESLEQIAKDIKDEINFDETVQSLNNKVLKSSRVETFHYPVKEKDLQALNQQLSELKKDFRDDIKSEFSIEYGEKQKDLYFSFGELMVHNNIFTYASKNLNYGVDEFYYKVGELTVKVMNVLETLVKNFLKEIS